MHTPGPWTKLSDHDRETIVSEQVNKYGNFIITSLTRGENEMTEEDRANARLIAAAPKLLEACKKLLNICQWKCGPNDEIILPCGTSNQNAMIEAVNAIAKATNE